MIRGISIATSLFVYVFYGCTNLCIVDANNNNNSDEITIVTNFQNTYRRLALLKECQYDCTKDTDCQKGLLCAAKHRAALKKLNVDPRLGYCSGVPGAGKYDDVCYNPKKLPSKPLLKECQQTECTLDKQCMKGLECSARHQDRLQKRDVDLTSAYCMNGAINGTCYDPKKLPPVEKQIQCPKPLPVGGNSTCNITATPSCVSGPKYCCRSKKGELPNGKIQCNELKCFYLAGCTCDATYGWACYMAGLVINCLPPYQCSN